MGIFHWRSRAALSQRDLVRQDFALMREPGANGSRKFMPPPTWLLDLSADYKLVAFMGGSWTQLICFLDRPEVVRQVRATVEEALAALDPLPSVTALLLGNEIPHDVAHWNGPRRIAAS